MGFQHAEPFWQWLKRTARWNKPDVGWRLLLGYIYHRRTLSFFIAQFTLWLAYAPAQHLIQFWLNFLQPAFYGFSIGDRPKLCHTPHISDLGTPRPLHAANSASPPWWYNNFLHPLFAGTGSTPPCISLRAVFIGAGKPFPYSCPPEQPSFPRPQPYTYLAGQITHAFCFCGALRWWFQTNLYCPLFPARFFLIYINIFGVLRKCAFFVLGSYIYNFVLIVRAD